MFEKVDPRPKINVRELVVREHKESLNYNFFRIVNLNVNPEKVFTIVECVNTFFCGLRMTGIAVYVVAVEQPSRMTMKDAVEIHRQWLTSFHRCARLMMSLSG